MTTIKEAANQHKSKSSVRNITELKGIDVNCVIFEENEVDYPYKYIEENGERYKITNSVLSNLKALLETRPNLKRFQVTKSGKGMDTKYFVIPLD